MKSRLPSGLIIEKMKSRELNPWIVNHFLEMVEQVLEEKSDYVALDEVSAPDTESVIDPLSREDVSELEDAGKELLGKVAVIKLNGGRATTMGGRVPKGILTAKKGLSFLEIILAQMDAIRARWGASVPLILMNSFFTHHPTMKIVGSHPHPPLTFIQNQVPRLLDDSLAPLETGTDDDWAPPGHGDIYLSLKTTGLLNDLIRQGFRWAFVSNLDNLAACVEPWILGLLESEGIEFLLEVTDRTEADRKGGTLVVRNGHLDLLELGQVSPGDKDTFMDIERFRVFNTNNVWVNLPALEAALESNSLSLPIIRNRKNILGHKVIQLETAMGAAIGTFSRARGLRVGRDRFFPTKKTSDLFTLQSDACILDSMARLRKNPRRPDSLPLRPKVFFSSNFVESPDQLPRRFEDSSSVSLVLANSLEVYGSAFFERNVSIHGSVEINVPDGAAWQIPRGAVLYEGKYP
ncbi:MAG: UTP--glucose-1-phosphate uridylyltransferase [Desulfomonile tiedjei]|uniref:UTP--glucose-1-phosphate uridylyltransferase n=1 Tax=Desulfomonile tiedjei TaxID=2358 RepID=A0A9D6V053_9BACT|nr:UTP--glucose-1-phosphate uridylyltransferase [Desulfomonile tiedjei]